MIDRNKISGGFRQKGNLKKSLINRPLISVITVVYNDSVALEKTIRSVISQTYENLEFIIVDGNSNDGTIEILNKFDNNIDYWISEPDKGIYDAMNKGIEIASGYWLNFMNSNDTFYSDNSISSIFNQQIPPHFSVIYGDSIAYDEEFSSSLLVKAKNIKEIWKSMCFSHQSCFIKSDIIKKNKFNLNYSIASDYNMILTLYFKGYMFLYIPNTISRTAIMGLSYSNPKTAIETRKVYLSFKTTLKGIIYHTMTVYISILKSLVFRVLGEEMTMKIRNIKWKLLN